MTIGFPFGVGAISSLNTGFGDLEIWWSDFDGKSPRHLFMTVGSLAGPHLRSVKPIERPFLAQSGLWR